MITTFDFKARHAESFLKEGNKVKAYVQFKGRAIMFKERGELVLLKFAERLAEVGQPEGMPKLEGKRMLMIISPKGKQKKKEGLRLKYNRALKAFFRKEGCFFVINGRSWKG